MRTFAALEIIVCLKTFLLRCRLKVHLPKNLSPRSLDSKIQSQPMRKPPLRPASMSQEKSPTKIRRKSILKRSGTGKTLLRPQGITQLRVRRSKTIEATESTIIVKKGHFARNCLKPQKNYCQSWQSPYRWLVVIKRLLLGCPASIIRSDSGKIR